MVQLNLNTRQNKYYTPINTLSTYFPMTIRKKG